MTLAEALAFGREILLEAGIEEASLDAWYLLSEAAGVSRSRYLTAPEEELAESVKTKYLEWIECRKRRVPLQYILGTQEFMGFSFHVNESVLIPRQDTEILTGEALESIRDMQKAAYQEAEYKIKALKEPQAGKETEQINTLKNSAGPIRVLDLCTGSGCIIISLAKLSQIEAYACDISEEALSVARGNAERLGADVKFRSGDLFEPVRGRYDIIVSNPPYIVSEEIGKLMPEVRDFEPRLALDGSGDGLDFYRRIARGAGSHLKPGGRLLLEIGCEQAESVVSLLEMEKFRNIKVIKDYAGLDRVVRGDTD